MAGRVLLCTSILSGFIDWNLCNRSINSGSTVESAVKTTWVFGSDELRENKRDSDSFRRGPNNNNCDWYLLWILFYHAAPAQSHPFSPNFPDIANIAPDLFDFNYMLYGNRTRSIIPMGN
jgi:hypothetical protein